MDPLDIPDERGLVDFSELYVPDITSSDPEERKLARKIRIQKRVEALQRQQQLAKEYAVEEKQPEKPTLLQLQLERSSEVLRLTFLECEEQVTNIRVANDAREVDRREEEGIGREKVFEQLEQEANLAKEMFDEISRKWENVMRYNDPLNIHDEIRMQKEKCDELIKQKDDIISMLKNEVRMAENKFYSDQKVQNEDISTLAKRVENQVAMMRTAHRIELQAIEDVMILERTNMMENNDKRWLELYKKREEQELAISENKFAQKNEFEQVVTQVRTKHYERIREVKIRLERDCENLQHEFEDIKATAMTNKEKMDYNYQILKKREDENIIIKSNQKRKLNKLRDVINRLRTKISQYTTDTENETKKLFNEVLALQKCIESVRIKSANMSRNNETKYMQVWDLNKKVASKILTKLITIDKLLHEHQLGLKWEEPPNKLLKRENLKSYIEAVDTILPLKDRPIIKKGMLNSSSSELELSTVYRKLMFNVLEKIADRSSFLIEYRLRKILEPLKKEEGELIKVDNVFSGLGITTNAQIELMFQFFKPYVVCLVCSAQKAGTMATSINSSTVDDESVTQMIIDFSEEEKPNPLAAVVEKDDVVDTILMGIVDPERLDQEKPEMVAKEGECLGLQIQSTVTEKKVALVDNLQQTVAKKTSRVCLNHAMAIDATSVLKAVREFVGSTFCSNEENANASSITTPQRTLTISRLLSQEDVKTYWNRYMLVLDEKKVTLWDSLWHGMQKYHDILEDRCKLNETLASLRRQNHELKHLLARYRNEADMKPPCAKQRDPPIIVVPQIKVCKKK